VVYGRLYKFNPSKQGLLYLPMLVGSLLAECGTGQAGDKCVAADLSGNLGVLIGRRNADYATSKKAVDVESPKSATTIHRPEGDSRSDSTKVPEMRLVIALFGVLVCIVSGLQVGFKIGTCSLYFLGRPSVVWYWSQKAPPLGKSRHREWRCGIRCPNGHLHLVSSSTLHPQRIYSPILPCRFSYVVDCYPKSAKEVVTIMNIFRVLSSFVVLFYNQRLNHAVGYDVAFGIESIVTAVFGLGGLGVLVAVGGKFR